MYDYHGITFFAASNDILIDNVFSYNRLEGIVITNSHITSSNNNCSNNGESGIHLHGANDCEISHNTCNNNGRYGIFFDESSNSVVINNTCGNNIEYGLYLSSDCNLNDFRNNKSIFTG